ncbi:MAG: hypothetical protein M3463_13515, partial [Verrucomicrobiota bacterium]|nr:hypothetical protein [Verrucomicrobiota bacterium]
MTNTTDIQPIGAALYFLPVQMRVPLKFGAGTVTSVTCARVRLRVRRADGLEADGWGETPLSVQWVWPSPLPYERRDAALQEFCDVLARAWAQFAESGHALEIGHAFCKHELPARLREFNSARPPGEAMPWLAALVCCSAFDLALHDAYGRATNVATYETYREPWLRRDLAHFLTAAEDRAHEVSFAGKWPADFFRPARCERLLAWHLV